MKETIINDKLEDIALVLNSSDSFFLAGHINPDGDTLGSMIAIASVLKRRGKKVYLFSNDPIPDNLQFLPGSDKIKVARIPKLKYDTMILLECSVLKRAGNLQGMRKRVKTVINIDHHKTSANFGHINLVDNNSSSTAEIIYRLFSVMGEKITAKEAKALYVGIITDTGRFQFPSTNSNTHFVVSELLKTGFNFARINKILYSTKAYPALKILGKALSGMELSKDGKAAFLTLTNRDFRESGALLEHTENIINYGMMVPSVRIASLFRQEPERISVTFRSKGNMDVSSLAKKFGGGGHKYASGCKISESLFDVKEKVKKAVLQRLK